MLSGLIRRVRLWNRLERDIFRLRGLDDHLLADVGVERPDIRRFVSGRLRR